jgi:parvulin-like peptidyl-prolyl isomerase
VTLSDLFKVPEDWDPVVAKVGDVPITKEMVESRLRKTQIQLDAVGYPDTVTREEILRGAVDYLVERELMKQIAEGKGVVVQKERVDEMVKEIEDRMQADPKFAAFLSRAGNTHAERVEDSRLSALVEGLQYKMVEELSVRTATTMKAYYDTHQRDFQEYAGREVWRIFIKAPSGMNERDREAAKLRAEQVLADAKKKGANFENLARLYSEGGNANTGGYLGFVAKGTLPPDQEKAIYSAKPNSILPLQQDATGWYIMKIGKDRKERVRPFDDEEVQREIFEIIGNRILDKEMKRLIEDSRKTKVTISPKVPEMPK